MKQVFFSLKKAQEKKLAFPLVVNKKVREQGLLQLKTKEFTTVNDCLHLERNAVIGLF